MNDTELLPERSEFVSALLAALTTPSGQAMAEAALHSRTDQTASADQQSPPCACVAHPAVSAIAAHSGV